MKRERLKEPSPLGEYLTRKAGKLEKPVDGSKPMLQGLEKLGPKEHGIECIAIYLTEFTGGPYGWVKHLDSGRYLVVRGESGCQHVIARVKHQTTAMTLVAMLNAAHVRVAKGCIAARDVLLKSMFGYLPTDVGIIAYEPATPNK